MPAFAVLAVLAAIMLWRLAMHAPRLAGALAVAFVAVAYLAATEPLGHPKPIRIEMLADLDGARVSYFEGSPETEIRIVTEGMWRSLPWSERTARALHEATQGVEAEGGTVVLRRPEDGTPGGEWSAERVAPAAAPPKN